MTTASPTSAQLKPHEPQTSQHVPGVMTVPAIQAAFMAFPEKSTDVLRLQYWPPQLVWCRYAEGHLDVCFGILARSQPYCG